MDTDRLFIPNEWLQNPWNCSAEWFILPVCLRLLWVLLQNMKYTKSRGLQGPNIFVALSCTGFLSDFFAAKFWSYIPFRFPLILVANTIIISKLEEASTNISICLKWTLNRVFEPNTKRNAEIIWIIQIHRQHWKTINTKNSNNDFLEREQLLPGILNSRSLIPLICLAFSFAIWALPQ